VVHAVGLRLLRFASVSGDFQNHLSDNWSFLVVDQYGFWMNEKLPA